MPDYQKGKIYAIWDDNYTECYIGSTCEELSQRMAQHRSKYKRYLNHVVGARISSRSILLFDKYGIDNCGIELIETYPCNNKSELRAREGYHQRENTIVNRCIAGRNKKQYYEENKEFINQKKKIYAESRRQERKIYNKQYYHDNKECLSQQMKTYHDNHKEANIERAKRYYLENKSKVQERKRQTTTCDCGSVVKKYNMSVHLKTLKHQQYLNQTGNDEP